MVQRYKGQKYSSLKSACTESGTLFEDPYFPAANESLYYSKQPSFNAVWKRPKDIVQNPRMFVDGASSADVTQGQVGNCWFVAAAASLAMEKNLLYKVIPDQNMHLLNTKMKMDYQGIFRFQFYRFGEWIEVVIDDRLPTVDGALIYVRSQRTNEFWSALLEKAYAKLAGSYEALESGNPADALVDFTGGVSERVDLVKDNYNNDESKRNSLYAKMEALMDRDTLCSASVKVNNRVEMEEQLESGIVKGHAYGIVEVKTILLGDHGLFSKFMAEKLFMVKLRNPWGTKEWNGAWSDGSKEWDKLSKTERQKLDIKVENEGEFWMSFKDFCLHFTTLTICVLVNTSFFSLQKTYYEGSAKGQWIPGYRAGGCIQNKETFLFNPQYRFDIGGNDKVVAFVSLMQPDNRQQKANGGRANLTIGFFVMRVEANRSYRIHQMYDKAGESKFSNSREVSSQLELQPGRYVVVPSTLEPDEEAQFFLRIYTDRSNGLTELVDQEPSKCCCGLCYCLPCLLCKPPLCQLSVVVVSVAGLKKKSSVSLGVDAYCIIEVEGTKVRSPVHTNELNPKFDYGGLFYIKRPSAVLKIQVWDHNTLLPDRFLGEVIRSVDITDKTLEITAELKDSSGSVDEYRRLIGSTVTFKMSASFDLRFK